MLAQRYSTVNHHLVCKRESVGCTADVTREGTNCFLSTLESSDFVLLRWCQGFVAFVFIQQKHVQAFHNSLLKWFSNHHLPG
jgi:hypothetical protein